MYDNFEEREVPDFEREDDVYPEEDYPEEDFDDTEEEY